MQHFYDFFRNADSVHVVVKTKIQTQKNGEAILASDKICLWLRVTVLITLLMPVVIALNFAAIKTPL